MKKTITLTFEIDTDKPMSGYEITTNLASFTHNVIRSALKTSINVCNHFGNPESEIYTYILNSLVLPKKVKTHSHLRIVK